MVRNTIRVGLAFGLAFIILQASIPKGYSQSNINLSVENVDDLNFPTTNVDISVSDDQGFPIRGLTIDNFTLIENSKNLPLLSVSPIYQKPVTIVLLIDSSRSTAYGSTPSLSSVIHSAAEFIDTLALNDLTSVISFSDEVIIEQAPTSDKRLIKDALNSISSQGNASLNDAIVKAVDVMKDLPGRRLLILLTDGPDSGYSSYTFDQAIDEAARKEVIVYPIAWGGADKEELNKLAELTGGQILSLTGDQPDLNAFQAAFSNIASDLPMLREQYEFSFLSTQIADGNEHEFIVRISYLGQEVEQVGHLTAHPGTVVLSLPDLQDSQVVGGKVRFAPIITSPASVASLDISMDGQSLYSSSTAPFEYTWDSITTQSGFHNFVLSAQDTAGNSGQMAISLLIQLPISITIENPADQQTISGPTKITAEVTALAQVTKVALSIDDIPLATVNSAPYEYTWDLKDVPAGNHRITATAFDINGYSSQNSINVIVAIQQKSGLLWIAAIAVLVVGAVLIPLSLRSRNRLRKRSSSSTMPLTTPDSVVSTTHARLRELEGLNPEHIWELSSENVKLGRKRDENDIALKGMNASRKQAEIHFIQGKYVIKSLNSENPVIINDEPVQQQVLSDGDVIKAGETVFKFELSGNGA